jgi:hypothetical protein
MTAYTAEDDPMATNVEERQITALKSELATVQAELDTLKTNLQKFFDSRDFQIGVGTAWRKTVRDAEEAAQYAAQGK